MKNQLSDVLKISFDSLISNTHTALPGRIEKYDNNKKKAEVKPLIKRKFFNGEIISLPIIVNVPVIFPSTNTAVISFPLNKGDGCLLIFSERSLERYLSSNLEEVEPQDPRKFSISDAICIPGLFTFSNPGKIGNGDALEIINDGGNKHIELNGKSKSFVTHAELDAALQTFITALNLHIHSGVTTGPGTSGVPVTPLTLDITASETQTIKTGG